MDMKKIAIAIVLLSTAGALWASMTAPLLPAPRLVAPLLERIRPVAARPEVPAVTPVGLDDQLQAARLVLTQA